MKIQLNIKRAVSIVLCAALLAISSVIPVNFHANAVSVDITIDSQEKFLEFAKTVYDKLYHLNGFAVENREVNAVLETDLEIDYDSLTEEQKGYFPIACDAGEESYDGYVGTFEGNSHKIKFSINLEGGYGGYAALFTKVSETGYVQNLVIDETSSINANDSGSASGIVSINYGTISNCHFLGKSVMCMDSGDAAGIVSKNFGTVEKCSVSQKAVISSDGGKAGGIAAENHGIIRDCLNVGTVTGDIVGGIAAVTDLYSDGSSVVFERCINVGKLNGTTVSGSIIGQDALIEDEDMFDIFAEYLNYKNIFADCYSDNQNYTAFFDSLTEDSAIKQNLPSDDAELLTLTAELNSKSGSNIWKFTSGSDSYPNFTGLDVVKDGDVYKNKAPVPQVTISEVTNSSITLTAEENTYSNSYGNLCCHISGDITGSGDTVTATGLAPSATYSIQVWYSGSDTMVKSDEGTVSATTMAGAVQEKAPEPQVTIDTEYNYNNKISVVASNYNNGQYGNLQYWYQADGTQWFSCAGSFDVNVTPGQTIQLKIRFSGNANYTESDEKTIDVTAPAVSYVVTIPSAVQAISSKENEITVKNIKNLVTGAISIDVGGEDFDQNLSKVKLTNSEDSSISISSEVVFQKGNKFDKYQPGAKIFSLSSGDINSSVSEYGFKFITKQPSLGDGGTTLIPAGSYEGTLTFTVNYQAS